MKKLKLYIPVLLVSFLLTGCYTQLSMRPSDNDYPNEQSQDDGDNYYETPEDTGEYYTDTEPYDNYDNNEEYIEDEDSEINNYYIGSYPFYHRYYWGYYPSISFGINFGYSYYDPYSWDPFYYGPWCGSYYYPPYYSYYYYPSYYLPVYSYPYYGGHWSSGNGVYRERNNTGLRLRNNDGLRSSYTTRGTLTRGNNTITKGTGNRERDAVTVKNATRNGVSNRTGNNDIRKMKNEPPIEKRVKNNNTIRNKNSNEKNKNTAPNTIRKNNSNGKNDSNYKRPENRSYKNGNKQTERKSGVKQERKYNTPKTYSPPQRNSNPPQRNYSPPQRNSNPPQNRGGNSGGGNNSGGRKTR